MLFAVDFILRESRDKAVKRFRSQMKQQRLAREDIFEDWLSLGLAGPVTCGAILRRLRSSKRANRETVDVVVSLCGGKREDHTTHECPSDAPPYSNAMEVHCPSITYDHRVVVLGQLPERDLHAAVFVQPAEFSHWWPQHGERQPDPRAGLAFMVSVHLGNPQDQRQEIKLPYDFDVNVYAVRKPWDKGSDPRTLSDIEALVKDLGLVAARSCRIRREPGFKAVSVAHSGKGSKFNHPAIIPVRAPVTITWRGDIKVGELEIRRGFRDFVQAREEVRSGVTLTLSPALDGSKKRSDRPASTKPVGKIALPEADTYRVRLYPPKRPFVDALYEWWLDIS